MEKSNFCPNCGKPIQESAKFCRTCGIELADALVKSATEPELTQDKTTLRREINTIEDMENYLAELSEHASDSVGAALKAQLQVIRYVQSPTLYDSSFDLLFANLKKALKYAESPKMQDEIRERSAIMIQNYVFFMNAKLQFEIKVNREEQRELMEESCKMLAESAVEVAALAVPGGPAAKATMKAAVSQAVVNNMLKSDKNGDNLFTKICRWWNKTERTEEETEKFLVTLDKLTAKLYKQREIIRKSDLLSGLIERYAKDMTDYFYGDKVILATRGLNYQKEWAIKQIKNWGIGILGCNAVSVVARWMWRGAGDAISFVGAKIADTEYIADNSHWALTQWGYAAALWILISLIVLFIYISRSRQARTKLAAANKEYQDCYRNYMNIAQVFNED